MKDSKTLLLNYLASVRDPERAASLFADDGVFETAVPALARGRTPLHRPPRDLSTCSKAARNLSELRVRA